MARAAIPVDLFNPGQVFACLGLMEAADVLLGSAHGAFDWLDGGPSFHLSAGGTDDPVRRVMAFLAEARVSSVAPLPAVDDAELSTAKWQVPTITGADDTFPFSRPASPATLPARLEALSGEHLTIDHWGDSTRRDSVKFWAGSGGYPGAGLVRDALELVRDQLSESHVDPFMLSAPQSSGFRLDWRRDYVPVDVGFSPNLHTAVVMVGYPLVDLLATFGLAHARPHRLQKLRYRYAALGISTPNDELIPIGLHRVALGGAVLPFSQRFFGMQLGWPGKPDQARCILDVTEETRR